MIIVMKANVTDAEIEEVTSRIKQLGFQSHVSKGVERTIIGAIGSERGKERLQSLEALAGVEKVVPILDPFKLASREMKPEKTIIKVTDEVAIGGEKLVVIAGPCSVESESQIIETALAIKEAGAKILRGGAFKPRTSPYSFQGLEEEGLILMAKARERTGLPIVTEIMNSQDLEMIVSYADILQIGARNVQNFALLKKCGKVTKPILLKRGMMTTIEEFLMSAEYILSEGNPNVILCERGIRTFETATRNTLDLSSIPVLQHKTHLPIIVDPSHATGHWRYVDSMSCAAIAAGADGLMIEVHPDPEKAVSDGIQSLKPKKFAELMIKLKVFAQAVNKMID